MNIQHLITATENYTVDTSDQRLSPLSSVAQHLFTAEEQFQLESKIYTYRFNWELTALQTKMSKALQ